MALLLFTFRYFHSFNITNILEGNAPGLGFTNQNNKKWEWDLSKTIDI